MLYMLHYILHLLLHLSMHFIPRFPPTSPLVPLVPSPPLPQLSSLRGWAAMKSLCAKRSGALHRADTQPTHTNTHTHTHTHMHRDRQTLIHPHTADSNSTGTTKGTDSQGHCIVWPHNETDETDNTHKFFNRRWGWALSPVWCFVRQKQHHCPFTLSLTRRCF